MDKQGTGDTLFEREVDGVGAVVVKDDGASDKDTVLLIDGRGSITTAVSDLRRQCSDDSEFMDKLESIFGGSGGPSGHSHDPSPVFGKPVAGKCPGCNETFPRTMVDDEGKCEGCGGDVQ